LAGQPQHGAVAGRSCQERTRGDEHPCQKRRIPECDHTPEPQEEECGAGAAGPPEARRKPPRAEFAEEVCCAGRKDGHRPTLQL
jgi:hypothetical protein